MAPEQLTGQEIDARTDIHAVGLILYEIATGQRPFAELRSEKLFGAILHDAPLPPSKLNPKVSSELERIVGKCLEKYPQNPYQSVHELGQELRHFGTSSHPATAANRGVPALLPSINRWKKWIVLGSSAALFLGIGIALRFAVPTPLSHWLGSSAVPRVKQLAVLP